MTDLRRVLPASLLLLLAAGGCTRAERPADVTQNAPVIVISIDTLRADRVGAWGYASAKTPHLDRLAADGVLFRNAFSHVPLTLPSHVSLMTGLLPPDHGVRDNVGYRLRDGVASLPQLLRANGYATGGAVSAYVLRGSTGMGAMFETYDDQIAAPGAATLGDVQRAGEETAAIATRWIAAHAGSPFFYFLHLFEPHTPYTPPQQFLASTSNTYDGEVAHADAIVGAFLDDLKARGIYDRALVIVLSDHGEGLGDHGEAEHGIFVYREAIHVPLLVKLPRNERAGTVVERAAGLTDVLPTVLSMVGVAVPPGLSGRSLFAEDGPRRIFSESLYPRLHLGWSDLRSLTDGTHHYIDAPRSELYAMRTDPAEQHNVAASDRRTAASFREELARYDRKLTAAPSAVSAEEAAKLAALGYVSAPAAPMTGDLIDPKDGIAQFAAFTAAKDAFAKGEVDEAIAGLRRVLEENPNFTEAAAQLAAAYERANRHEEAAATYRSMLARNPALKEQVALGVGRSLMRLRRFAEARRHAELVLSSNAPAAHLLLAKIDLAAGEPVRAQEHARAALGDEYYAAEALPLLAQALLAKSGGEETALQTLEAIAQERAAAGKRPLRSYGVARAGVLMRMSRAADAAAALRAEIRAYPDNAEAYGRLAAVHLLQRDPRAAEAVLEELVRAVPGTSSYELAVRTLEHFGQAAAAARWRTRAAERRVSR
jgi:choline-sulfatase